MNIKTSFLAASNFVSNFVGLIFHWLPVDSPGFITCCTDGYQRDVHHLKPRESALFSKRLGTQTPRIIQKLHPIRFPFRRWQKAKRSAREETRGRQHCLQFSSLNRRQSRTHTHVDKHLLSKILAVRGCGRKIRISLAGRAQEMKWSALGTQRIFSCFFMVDAHTHTRGVCVFSLRGDFPAPFLLPYIPWRGAHKGGLQERAREKLHQINVCEFI